MPMPGKIEIVKANGIRKTIVPGCDLFAYLRTRVITNAACALMPVPERSVERSTGTPEPGKQSAVARDRARS
jgi:hypothetical protein